MGSRDYKPQYESRGMTCLFVDVGLNILDGVAHGLDFLSLVVGDGNVEHSFELHDQFYGVERICSEVSLET